MATSMQINSQQLSNNAFTEILNSVGNQNSGDHHVRLRSDKKTLYVRENASIAKNFFTGIKDLFVGGSRREQGFKVIKDAIHAQYGEKIANSALQSIGMNKATTIRASDLMKLHGALELETQNRNLAENEQLAKTVESGLPEIFEQRMADQSIARLYFKGKGAEAQPSQTFGREDISKKSTEYLDFQRSQLRPGELLFDPKAHDSVKGQRADFFMVVGQKLVDDRLGTTLFEAEFKPKLKQNLELKMDASSVSAVLDSVDPSKFFDFLQSAVDIEIADKTKSGNKPEAYSELESIDRAIKKFAHRATQMESAIKSFDGIKQNEREAVHAFVKDRVYGNPYFVLQTPEALKAAMTVKASVMELAKAVSTPDAKNLSKAIVELSRTIRSEIAQIPGQIDGANGDEEFCKAAVNLAFRTSGMTANEFFGGLQRQEVLSELGRAVNSGEFMLMNCDSQDAYLLGRVMKSTINAFGENAVEASVIKQTDQPWVAGGSPDPSVLVDSFEDFPQPLQEALNAINIQLT